MKSVCWRDARRNGMPANDRVLLQNAVKDTKACGLKPNV